MLNLVKCLILFFLVFSQLFAADIKLPIPDKSNKTTLIDALQNRYSCRDFSGKEIDTQTLSNLLWAAYGVNRSDGKRTIPTARNKKDLDIYVFNKNGIFLYDAEQNILLQKSKKNNLSLFGDQDYIQNITALVYTGTTDDYAIMHAGSSYQNVELFTAANNMASLVKGSYDKENLPKVLKLKENQRVIVSQIVGYKK